ncbi:amidase domain-containing protein [Anaerobacillus sp. MEB173]|uniref:amidase domain-containing protein n=1 Tax=Anaerobacillus sp. MEB173 TaxID=3383345 RepID=UPI003F9296B5
MTWFQTLKANIEKFNDCLVNETEIDRDYLEEKEQRCLYRKKEILQRRNAEIVKSTVNGNVIRQHQFEDERQVEYWLHYQYLTKLKDKFYIEEAIQTRMAIFNDDTITKDYLIHDERTINSERTEKIEREIQPEYHDRFTYNRLEAIRYAERWWDARNPAYKNFNDNCTNFISQCLHAGRAPMTGSPNRSKGWWYSGNNWSFSWTVAHSFRWYMSGAKSGLRGNEVSQAELLEPGDIICYDFDGNGRWQHTTIVVAKDANNEPLVNAHTSNSRMRYWSYEDSTAYTPNIQYKFFKIVDR